MTDQRLIPIVKVKKTISDSESLTLIEGNFSENDNLIQVEFNIIYNDIELTDAIKGALESTSRALLSMIDFSNLGFESTVLEFSVSPGSTRIWIVTAVVASFNIVANYDSLKENLPLVADDIARIVRMIMDNVPVDTNKDNLVPRPHTPIIPTRPSIRPPSPRKTVRHDL